MITTYLNEWCMMCSDSIVVSPSRIEMTKTLEILTLTALSQNVGNHVASDMASYLRLCMYHIK